MLIRAVSVLCFLRNPECLEYIRLFSLSSIIFDKTGRTDIGRKLQRSHSNLFLSNGVTLAVFQLEGNFPLEKGGLVNLAILVATAAAEERKRRALMILSMPDDL